MSTLVSFSAASLCEAQQMKNAYIRLYRGSHRELANAARAAESLGAVLRHRVYPYAMMGEIPAGSEPSLRAVPGVRDIFVGHVPRDRMGAMAAAERNIAKAYNAVYYGFQGSSEAGPEGDLAPADLERVIIDPGPLRIPERYLEGLPGTAGDMAGASRSWPPTSEFMLGHVAVGVIMPESDGVGSHDWTDAEEEKMVEEVISAMNFWAKHAPGNALEFTYEINYRVPVRVEPLDRGGWMIEDKWAGMSLSSLGFEGSNYFVQSYSYVNEIKRRYDSDWGFLIFILHGREGQSFGSFLAYSYLGGPFNVNVSSNGSLGPDNLDRVIAHETGHTFYTLDEYPSSPHDCSVRSGYLNVENANKYHGGETCKLNVMCIMRGADPSYTIDLLPPCVYTKGQVGWWDSDEDGIPDVLDTDPVVESLRLDLEETGAVAAGDTLFSSWATFDGSVAAAPLINMNMFSEVSPRSVTIEPVRAEYRLDGGPWTSCEPGDLGFDSPSETFSFAVHALAPFRWHKVDVRSVTEHGNVTPDSLVESIEFFSVPRPGKTAVVNLTSSSPARYPVSISFAPEHRSGASGEIVAVRVAVYDVTGRRVAVLEDGDFETGRFHWTQWDGLGTGGERMPAGVYFVSMKSGGKVASRKLLVIP